MSSNILQLPFRRTHAVSLSAAIKQYISAKYDQHPDMFTQDLETVDQLRSAAVAALEPHGSGIRKLQLYAAQLMWMGTKFPADIGVEFTWYPAIGYNTHRPLSQDNLRFELANILFNLAAMYSQIALASNRSTSDGLKSACNHFCSAAGVIAHLKQTIIPDMRTEPPDDMDVNTLESIEHLMLAQAQECFWQKAVKDGLKDASIAKLAAKVSDFYSIAGDWAVKSDAVSSEWIHHMNAKHHHFAAAAQYRAACDCLEKRKYGEEVARLHDSVVCVNEALKESRYINKAVQADLHGLKNKVQEDLKRAEKDNDLIYLSPVPTKAELKVLDRANMVAAKIPREVADCMNMLGDRGELGRPLFARLVPYSVHVAASIYVDRRDRLVNEKIIQGLQRLDGRIHEMMQVLNLPGSLQALEKPLGLPPATASHAEDIRQQDGMQRLRSAMADTEKLKNGDQQTYQEGVDLLRAEAVEDEQARRKYGTERWSRSSSNGAMPRLYAQVTEIEGYLKQAGNSDKLVQRRVRENESLIRLLGGSDRDLEDYVPSSRRATMTAKVERETNNLRSILNDVSRLEARRKRKADSIRAKAKADDIHEDLLQEAARFEREYPMQSIEAVQFEDLFDKRLSGYDADQNAVSVEESEQEELLVKLQQASESLNAARRGDSSTKEREQALQRLENAYTAYKDIIGNLETGRKFYNDLAVMVARFRDECRNFAYQRRAEAAQFEADLSTSMARMDLQSATTENLRQQQQKQQRQQHNGAVESAGRRTDVRIGGGSYGASLAAPTPARVGTAGSPLAVGSATAVPAGGGGGVWTPEMGIRFGSSAEQSPSGPDGIRKKHG